MVADQFARERAAMVRTLTAAGIRDRRVLWAMGRVPRERFVREEDREIAYGDHALSIGEGQTISQPYIVARMTELLAPRPMDHVLEVGTGSGYQAAVLAELVGDVVTAERVGPLAQAAAQRLAALGYRNVRVVQVDASTGYGAEAPYDEIVVTAATPRIAPALVAQCRPAGRVVAPVGDRDVQYLVVRHPAGREERYGAVKFVPLRGTAGFRE